MVIKMNDDIAEVKEMISGQYYKECEALISSLMLDHPHSALPHNLMGILLEKQGRHEEAMRHFRAAYALNPQYEPAEKNMESFGSFALHEECDYGEGFSINTQQAAVKESR
jgi:Flp pilus assembly protein TadD